MDERALNRETAAEGEDVRLTDGALAHVGTLQLRSEVLSVSKERVPAGQVTVSRRVETRTETFTAELRRETLVITVQPGTAQVYLGEELLAPGETREVLVYEERAVLERVPVVTEEVHVGKRTVTETHRQQVDLQYEVLSVEERPVMAVPGEVNDQRR